MRVTKPMLDRATDEAARALGLSVPVARAAAKRILHAACDEPLEGDADRQIEGQVSLYDYLGTPTTELPSSHDSRVSDHG